MEGDEDSRPAALDAGSEWEPLTTEPREPFAADGRITTSGAVAGGLFAAAGAAAAALADRDPRRRSYVRHMMLIGLVIAVGGSAVVIAIAWLFG
jgi:hypothetical protein